ncbi:MAG: alpha/beta hydrolase [Rhizobiaceae bacterium]
MKVYLFLLIAVLVLLAVTFAWTNAQIVSIENAHVPTGSFVGPEGERTHFVDIDLEPGQEGPTALFIHGASGNLNDQLIPFEPALRGKARMIFIDRPGHGYSDRVEAETPAQQAARFKDLLDELNIEKVVPVGHSLGAASATAFAVLYPDRTKGLVLTAPATHSWSTGVNWYYDLAAMPVLGHLFTETVLVPFGMLTLESGTNGVFEPQTPPEDYIEKAGIALLFRPWVFRNNARDVAGLNAFVSAFSRRYKEITVPTVIITGDTDDVVSPAIHSIGLERDIKGSELIVLPGVGHKPEYTATQTVADAILKVGR